MDKKRLKIFCFGLFLIGVQAVEAQTANAVVDKLLQQNTELSELECSVGMRLSGTGFVTPF